MRTWILLLTACTADAGLRVPTPTSDEALRAQGPEGLARLLADPHPDDPAWRERVDRVAAQEDAVSSGLYWYTDRDEAVRVARASGRPVLSLRMLGELTDPFSCANSRFFRRVLYADPRVADHLRERFVLHWSSERPVPRITIEMGDGRVLERTITGNSAHYVLDTEGRPIDVLPGLYTPEHFLDELASAETLFRELQGAEDRSAHLQAHHRARQDAALERLVVPGRNPRDAVLERWGPYLYDAPGSRPLTVVPAGAALPLAVGKMQVELPIAEAFLISRPPLNALHPADLHVQETWRPPADLASRIRSDQPQGGEAVVGRFAATLLRDSIWNRDVLHTRIRSELIRDPDRSFEALNAWVYTYAFGTPAADPWLGLYDPGVYVALPQAGVHDQRNRIP